MRFFNGLNMGEGIAGPSTIGAATTAIYSCMGVAFVNRKLHFGGLYHYPATSLNNMNVVFTMRQMFNDISPDEIVLTPAQDTTGTGTSGSYGYDVDEMTEFLQGFGAKVTVAAGQSLAVLYWKDDQPVFNQLPNGMKPEGVPTEIRIVMNSHKREIEGDIWYYGGDGEVSGVLLQGLKRKSGKKHCIIL